MWSGPHKSLGVSKDSLKSAFSNLQVRRPWAFCRLSVIAAKLIWRMIPSLLHLVKVAFSPVHARSCHTMSKDVGTNGRISDGGAWGKCKLKFALDRNTVNLPEDNNFPLTTTKVPYVIVADDAFPLSLNLMKPYPGRGLNDEEMIFNYRLSRARRVSENAFGILAARFQIFKQRILTSPVNATKIVMARCALHNFLISRNPALYIPASSIDTEVIEKGEIQRGNWRDSVYLKPLSH
ncbi:hypothetical protein AVEN_12477-1 [Araneus ventricosus]|uniref:DDE Tnp4 domain-containing protein n=1 Tax=Araneus ventricosus TaxID=182803 RepID=A0A4Y2XAX3_ARAVE|nr:hypothetical protein AVEN_12477-1 [Araneus ventricosus]